MAYRFTNTDKWNDTWFYELDLRQKAVFLYLCDFCDIAGFYEINLKRMAQDIGISDADVKGALKGLYSRIIYSTDGKYLFLRNFIKHQKNLPLNEKNNAHKGIIERLNYFSQHFGFKEIKDFLISPTLGADKGLFSPLGNGNGNGNGKKKGGLGENKKFVPPSLPEFKDFFTANGYSIELAERAYRYYELGNWHDSKGSPIKNWKQKCHIVWFKPENKTNETLRATI